MKTISKYSAVFLLFLVCSCIVVSYHPLYTEKDLFANDLLLGSWLEDDSTVWQFSFDFKGEAVPENVDSTAYLLRLSGKGETELSASSFKVHLIKLEGQYFLDFFLQEYRSSADNGPDFFDLHVVPVHSFACLDLTGEQAVIRWFDPGWLEDLAKKGELDIKYEVEDGNYLLTASTEELQKFVVKYSKDPEALDDGLFASLKKLE
ncbi:hypothetical protein [Mangrovibacterium lignilyticum]|uniref:hypothetical protein n=1 Tax=Mangrovibacterium lignilyticum TaxID=2668052 RepID=UPI0013D578BB|nr:hypothetical protein [Mangrovibacterium lignilyticum]